MNKLHAWHNRTLTVALRIPVLVITGASLIVIISLWVFSRMGGEFLPTLEEGDLACQMTLPAGSSLSQSIATSSQAETILLETFPEVIHVVSKIGSAEVPTDPMAIEDADIMITMRPKNDWVSAATREEMMEKMKEALAVIPGASFDFTQPIQLRFNELMTGVKTDVAVKIFGEDLDVLFDEANKAAAIISGIDGAGDVKVEQIVGLPQLVVTYDRDKMSRYGLNINEINDIVRTAFAGRSAGLVFEGERRFDLVVRLDESFRKNIDALYNLRINRPDEELILLNQVADIREVSGPMLISREEARRRATIGINVRNRDIESFIEEVNRALSERMNLPPGYYITYGGQFENLKTAKRTSAIAVPVALAAIFILLFFAFHSFKQSVMVFTAIPLAAVGGIFALLIRGMPFSISAGVGFIALFGIAVLNGIVLISHYNQLEQEGVSDIWERIKRGTSDRLRPVILTSLVAALGFIPMALSTAAGAEVQKPLATVVIGGILTASVLTLVVLPVLYYTFNEGFHCALKKLIPGRKLPVAILLLFLLVPVLQLNAQDPAPRILTLDGAIDLAMKHAIELKNNELNKKAEHSRILAEFNLASPSVSLETGQINSALSDYKILISQEIEFPMVYVEQITAQKARYRRASIGSGISTNQYLGQVMQVYMSWWIAHERVRLRRQQDSIFRVYHEAAVQRLSTGDITPLDLLVSESRIEQSANSVKAVQSDLEALTVELGVLIHSDSVYFPPDSSPEALVSPPGSSLSVDGNPRLQYLEWNLKVEQANLRKESWKLAPSFSVGWFTQSLDEVSPYTGWQYGISVPIWLWAPVSRIKEAKINREIARNEVENGKHHLAGEIAILQKGLEKADVRLDYFTTKGFTLSASLALSATKGYQAGEISLFEYVFTLNEAFGIQLDYLDALEAYNSHVIQLKQIIGSY